MDLISADSTEMSASSDAETGVVSSPRTDWIKDAIQLRRYHDNEPRRRENKKLRLPLWLIEPTPLPPPQRHHQCHISVLALRRWREEWRARDWEEVELFFRASDPDEYPEHDKIPQADPAPLMKSNRRKPRTRSIPLDASQTAVAIFAEALGYEPLYLPASKAVKKVRTAKLRIKRG